METTIKFNLLQTISFIYDESKDSKLSETLFEKINPKLEELISKGNRTKIGFTTNQQQHYKLRFYRPY